MSDPTQALHDFKPTQDFFIGLDSDGCIFDSMEIKHKECFTPMFIQHFQLQAVSKYAREVWEFVNLYSKDRGTNRFSALVKAIQYLGSRPQVKARSITLPDITGLKEWVTRESKLDDASLNAEIARGNSSLAQTKTWSDAVNRAVEEIAQGVPPFPWVRESLSKLSERADAMCVSQTPVEALKREWSAHKLDSFVQIIAGQEMGTKTEQLKLAAAPKYRADRILMVGDAPGDFKAAKANNALFFPISPGREEDSWKRLFTEGLDHFFNGTYAGDYEANLVMEFDACLPERPTW